MLKIPDRIICRYEKCVKTTTKKKQKNKNIGFISLSF
jgi:hypothetical protein